MGQNSAGEWFTGPSTSFGERFLQVVTPQRLRPGETLPIVTRALNWQRQVDSSYTARQSLESEGVLAATDMVFQHGVAAMSTVANASADFQLTSDAQLLGDTTIELINDEMPVQHVSGEISGNITWSPDVEYRIVGDLTLQPDSTLTIQPGTRVLIGRQINVTVHGTLQSLGNGGCSCLVHLH